MKNNSTISFVLITTLFKNTINQHSFIKKN